MAEALIEISKVIKLIESKGFALDEEKHFLLEKVEGFGSDYSGLTLVESIDLNAQYESIRQYYQSAEPAKMHCVSNLENKLGRFADPNSRDVLLKQVSTPAGAEAFVLGVKDIKGMRRSFVLFGELELKEAHLSEFQRQKLAEFPKPKEARLL